MLRATPPRAHDRPLPRRRGALCLAALLACPQFACEEITLNVGSVDAGLDAGLDAPSTFTPPPRVIDCGIPTGLGASSRSQCPSLPASPDPASTEAATAERLTRLWLRCGGPTITIGAHGTRLWLRAGVQFLADGTFALLLPGTDGALLRQCDADASGTFALAPADDGGAAFSLTLRFRDGYTEAYALDYFDRGQRLLLRTSAGDYDFAAAP